MLPVGTRHGERVLPKDAPKRTGGGQKMRQQRSPKKELHRGAGTFARQQAQFATNMLKQEAWIPRRSLFLNPVSLGLPD
jgi:hypothetical protein